MGRRTQQLERTRAMRLAFAACAAACALSLAACSKSSDVDEDSDSGSGSKASSLDLGDDARGLCFSSALAAHGLRTERALRAIAARDGLAYSGARAALDAWPSSSFGAAEADVVACRFVD